jgi:hypothetical protein
MSSIEHRRKPRLLVEAIQEHQLIVSRKTLRLAPAVFVLATQNPIKLEGTYPLPVAEEIASFAVRLLAVSGLGVQE